MLYYIVCRINIYPSGKVQLLEGRRSHQITTEYIGDALANPPPICSYEISVLVKLLHRISLFLNRIFNLNPEIIASNENGHLEMIQGNEKIPSDEINNENGVEGFEKDDFFEERFRVNLRFLADMRNILFGLIVLCLFDLSKLYCILYFPLFMYQVVYCFLYIDILII